MRRSAALPGLVFPLLLLACGGGTDTSDSGPAGDECTGDNDCDDGLECTRDLCVSGVNQVRSCWHEPRDELCAEDETCQDATSPLPGCRLVAEIHCLGKAEDDACDPADPCATGTGQCVSGLCEYPVLDCPPQACRDSQGCDRLTGSCAYTDRLDGAACHEGGDLCRPGTCESGSCLAHDLVCDDQEACTTDSCDPDQGCLHAPETGGPCEDGDLCVGPDTCHKGTCQAGPPVSCDDGDPCTADACDPATGCSNPLLVPCCGNGILEEGEPCDEGPQGTQGCSPDCTFESVTLAAPPDPGRSPSVAWSITGDQGLVAYEVIHPDGRFSLETRTVDAHAEIGEPVALFDAPGEEGFQTFAPALGAVDPGGVFLLASYSAGSVDLRILNGEGAVQLEKPGAFDLGDAVPSGRIRVGAHPEVSAVAWEARTTCPDQMSIWEAWVAPVVAGPSSLLTVAPTRMAGSCEPKSRAVLGKACAGNGAVMVTLGQRTGTTSHQVSLGVVPVTPTGVGAYQELASFEGDLVQPPSCVASLDGDRFLLVYMMVVTSMGPEEQAALQLWTRFVDVAGVPDGPPTIIQSTSMDPEGGYQACFPVFATLSHLGNDQYIMACPVATMDLDGNASAMTLSRFVLNDQGLLLEGPVPFEVPSQQFALAVESVSGPGASALVAWHGRPDVVDVDPFLPPPYWVSMTFTGSF